MSKRAEAELRETICAANGCWAEETMTDAGVTALLGGDWHILLLDHHFSTCADPREGKICDGVAVYPNDNNNDLRVLELKQSTADYPDAAKKFHKSLPLVERRLPRGFDDLDVTVELHVKDMPTQTVKFRKELKVDGTKFGVRAFRDGEHV
jgi:hypothetical protein